VWYLWKFFKDGRAREGSATLRRSLAKGRWDEGELERRKAAGGHVHLAAFSFVYGSAGILAKSSRFSRNTGRAASSCALDSRAEVDPHFSATKTVFSCQLNALSAVGSTFSLIEVNNVPTATPERIATMI